MVERVGSSKNTLDDRETHQTLDISRMRPAFQTWLKNTPRARILTYCSIVIDHGFASDIQSACSYLDQQVANFPKSSQTPDISTGDLKGSRRPYLYPEIKRVLGEEKRFHQAQEPWSYGRISHEALPELFSGKLPLKKQPIPPNSLKEETLKRRGLAGDFISQYTINCLKRCNEALTLSFNTHGIGRADQPRINELYGRLSLIFDRHITNLERHLPALGIERFVKTLMSWASAAEYAKTQPVRILFTETPIVPLKLDINGWRPDAFEVIKIGNKPPNAEQQQILEGLSHFRYGSWVEIISEITRQFGPNFKARPVDWKMAIGDGVPSTSPIDPQDIPYPGHIKQLEDYITMATIASMIAHDTGTSDIWPTSSHFEEGEIVYILPGLKPLVSRVILPSNEQKLHLRENVAPRLEPAKINATIRTTENTIARLLLAIATNRPMQSAPEAYTLPLPLARQDVETNSIVRVIEHYTKYEDPLRILEIVKTKYGNEVYWLLHADRLIQGIQKGEIKYTGFKKGKGVFVQCLFSDHEDPGNPSMQIYFDSGNAYCHGCKRTAFFVEGSLPEELSGIPKGLHINNASEKSRGPGVETPESHHIIMSGAKDLLQKSFWGTRGEWYLDKKRMLNPDLAFSLGVGYAGPTFIQEMLTAGVSYEELKLLGFIGHGQRFDFFEKNPGKYPRQFLDKILDKHGVSLNEFILKDKEGNDLLPYSLLFGRLCFPLTLMEKHTNFYGRATWNGSDRTKHRKLPIRPDTKVEQGGFNTQALYLPGKKKYLVEAALDTIAAYELGLEPTVGLIGTANYAVLKEAQNAGVEEILLGLDNDQGGRDATIRNKKYLLEELAYKGKVGDLNEELSALYPDFGDNDDLAAYNKARKEKGLGKSRVV